MEAVGVAQWVLDRSGPAALARAAQLGFTAIHLDLDGAGVSVPAYAAAARDTGVAIAALATRSVEDAGLSRDTVWAALDAAAELGAPLVYVPCFHRTQIQNEDDLARTADFLHAACAHAGPVLVGSENSLSASGNRALVARVNHPGFRVLVDHCNAVLWGHDPLELVDARLPHACGQIHCKDSTRGGLGNAPLGDGDARFAQTCERLRATGFRGLVVSENDYRVDGERRAAHDLAALARHLGER